MSTDDVAIPHRVGVLERRADAHARELDDLQRTKADEMDLAKLDGKVDGLRDGKADKADLEKLASQLNSLRKVLVGLMVTIAASAIVFALSVIQFVITTGGLPK